MDPENTDLYEVEEITEILGTIWEEERSALDELVEGKSGDVERPSFVTACKSLSRKARARILP